MQMPILTFDEFNAYFIPITIVLTIFVTIGTYVALQYGQSELHKAIERFL
jgi:hypothetical protein